MYILLLIHLTLKIRSLIKTRADEYTGRLLYNDSISIHCGSVIMTQSHKMTGDVDVSTMMVTAAAVSYLIYNTKANEEMWSSSSVEISQGELRWRVARSLLVDLGVSPVASDLYGHPTESDLGVHLLRCNLGVPFGAVRPGSPSGRKWCGCPSNRMWRES